ncbi:hypothetical protein M1O29_02435 [Dehalococcoidia bacterium]|nr:hypothetical protein [Dehalococcoidia bacterium]
MNLWKMELLHLFRSWRGWTLVAVFLLASILSIVTGIFIERSDSFSHSAALDLYMMYSLLGTLLFIGIVVSAFAFDGNKDSSTFLRTRFSIKQILIAKVLVYWPLSELLFFLGFVITFVAGSVLFDTSDSLRLGWLLWGILLQLVGGLFYVALILFTSSVFKGSVASVLLTLAVVIGIPIIGITLMTIEMLMRGLTEIPSADWETVSYVARVLLWWPAALGDAQAFLSVTQSEVAENSISYFGQSFELDPHFRSKPLISTLVLSPLFALFAWRRYTRREL